MNQFQTLASGQGLLKNYYGTRNGTMDMILKRRRKKLRDNRMEPEMIDFRDGNITTGLLRGI